MQVNIIKLSSWRIPRQFVQDWMDILVAELKGRRLLPASFEEIHLVFVSPQEMKKMNAQFRGKDKPTDILSFEGVGELEWGELVLCGEVLDRQAKAHQMSQKEELGYLLIHGALHLLGYDHETSQKDAEIMFSLQDSIFEKLCEKILV